MDAPNRLNEVAGLLAPHWPFPNDDSYDDVRLSVLLKYIIPGLNRLDGGKWGCLTKTDQGNKIPGDILVWKDTNEVFDCLDSRGATWNSLGVNTNNSWQWTAVDSSEPIPDPLPPAPQDSITLAQLEAVKQEILALINSSHASIVTEVNQHLDNQVAQLNKALAPVVIKILGS